ncbi:MAG: bifunctional allantoicase/(S)-ureidoglycine aminohydrolase [Pseudomonadota bacterium]
MTHYAFPPGGLPDQRKLANSQAVFTTAYAVIPRTTMTDIVTSALPHWDGTRAWVLARPLTGFAETFSQMIIEVAPGGGSALPDTDPSAQSVLFVLDGTGEITVNGATHVLLAGSYVYLPPACDWALRNNGDHTLRCTWVRKQYQPVQGIDVPSAFVTHENVVDAIEMPGTDGAWATKRFVDPTDLRHDMHVNIVEFHAGAAIPFLETHVMEHGIYILEGKGVYRLNRDWVEVEGGDFLWLRAFCPQACYAGGPGRFRYLLYKDVNRHMALG